MTQAMATPELRRRANVRLLRMLDNLTFGAALGGAIVTIGLLLLVLAVIYHGAAPAIEKFGWAFLKSTAWGNRKGEYGVLPAVYGTLVTSTIALVLALPVSMGSAVFLTKIAPRMKMPLPTMKGIR